MVLENNPVNKNIVRAMRAVMFLLCIFKGFITADGYYNSNGILGFSMNGVWFYAALIVVVGAVNFLFYMLASSLSFSSMTRSRWVPVNDRGVCKVNYCTFHTNFALSIAVGMIIQGVLGLVIYFYPVSSALVTQVIMRVVTFVMVAIINITLMATVDKTERKNLFVSILACNIIVILLMG